MNPEEFKKYCSNIMKKLEVLFEDTTPAIQAGVCCKWLTVLCCSQENPQEAFDSMIKCITEDFKDNMKLMKKIKYISEDLKNE